MAKGRLHTPLFEKSLVNEALKQAFVRLDPRILMNKPLLFAVATATVFIFLICAYTLFSGERTLGSVTFLLPVTLVMLLSVLMANFVEYIIEERAKVQGESLRKTRDKTPVKKLLQPVGKANNDFKMISSSELKKGDVFICETGDIIPVDGEIIEGLASVDESAITGESTPMIREAGGDQSSVMGGSKVLSNSIKVVVTKDAGEITSGGFRSTGVPKNKKIAGFTLEILKK